MLVAPTLAPVPVPAVILGHPPASVPAPAAEVDAAPAHVVIRLERGSATAEEMAVVTTVLLARAAAARAAAGAQPAAGVRRAAARWRVHGFAGPRAWTTDARDLLAS